MLRIVDCMDAAGPADLITGSDLPDSLCHSSQVLRALLMLQLQSEPQHSDLISSIDMADQRSATIMNVQLPLASVHLVLLT